KLVTEYQKDNTINYILLLYKFYSITHNPAYSISDFIEGVLAVACQLKVIGHKPSDLEVSDKILIGLDHSWGSICTVLTLWSKSPTVNEITSALKQYEANEIGAEYAVKKEHGDFVLYAKGKGGGLKRKAKVDDGE